MREPMSKFPYQLLETLVICNPGADLLLGMTGRAANLKSLQLRGTLMTRHCWNGFPELLAACSSSLTELHLDVGDCQSTYCSDSTLVGGHWMGDNLEFPFTLSTHKCLKRLSISVLVFSSKHETELRIICALPAITSLIKTTPKTAVRDVVLRLHWMDPDIGAFGRLDWSHLFRLLSDYPGICPRIHLHISITSTSPSIILDALAENDVLMSFVEREMVILKPLEDGPNFF